MTHGLAASFAPAVRTVVDPHEGIRECAELVVGDGCPVARAQNEEGRIVGLRKFLAGVEPNCPRTRKLCGTGALLEVRVWP